MIDNLLERTLVKDGFILTYVKGTSMNPMLKEGRDRVVIKTVKGDIKKGDVVLYMRENGTYILHRVFKVTDSALVCCGDNHTVLEYGVKKNAVLGILTGYYKGNTYIDLNKSVKYKLYKALWGNRRNFRAFVIKIKSKIKKIIKK